MITEKLLKEVVLLKYKEAGRGHLTSSCPFCFDDNYHFYINKKTFKWDCKKCKEAGNIEKLLKKVDKAYLIEGEKIISLRRLTDNIQENVEEKLYEEINDCKLPIGFKRLRWEDNNEYTKYLKNRKVTKEDFDIYEFGYTNVMSKLKDYVICAITKDFSIKGYIGRYIGGEEDKKRYRNSFTKFSKMIFGYDDFTNQTENVILVEGMYDKISVTTELRLHDSKGFKSGATFGNKISPDQIALLRSVKSLKNIYLMYDGRDSIEGIKKYGLELAKYFNVKACYMPKNDPGDSNRRQLIHSIQEAETIYIFKYNKVQIRNF